MEMYLFFAQFCLLSKRASRGKYFIEQITIKHEQTNFPQNCSLYKKNHSMTDKTTSCEKISSKGWFHHFTQSDTQINT